MTQVTRSAKVLFFLFYSVTFSFAQNTLGYTEADVFFRNGVELFEKNNYAASRQEFKMYIEKQANLLNTNDYNAVSAEYYFALSSLYLNYPDAETEVARFVKKHPEHPKSSQIFADLGVYYYDREDYAKAISFFEKALGQNVNFYQATTNKYKLAMSYYMTQQTDKALPYFEELTRDASSQYFAAANYYAGVINFKNEDYNRAVENFKRIEQVPQYKADIPNWISACLYRSKRYDDLLRYTEPILERAKAGGVKLNDVALYSAEVYYTRNDYAKAATNYALFNKFKAGAAPAPILFRYGNSLFKSGNPKAAIDVLKSVSTRKDTIGQFSSYVLGISYLQEKNPTSALVAFDNASRLNFDRNIKEEATFTHAKLQLDLDNFNGSIKELQDFLKLYPESTFEDDANDLLVQAYTSANNNAGAIAYFESLPTKKRNSKVNAAYQRLCFNQATTNFNAERYAQAIVDFDKALNYPIDPEIKFAALFYKAESFSSLKRYEEAIPLYNQLLRSDKSQGNFDVKSLYALGYAYYNTKDYERALGYFKDYTAKAPVSDRQTVEDAIVRTADCYFAAKNYDESMRLYDKAVNEGRIDRDYAYYQKGLVLTYLERDAEAKAQFDRVITQFPTSRYADDALFQAASIDFEKGNYQVAIRAYSQLIKSKPKSYLVPASLLKRAGAYNNIQVYEESVRDYKRILSDFPTSAAASGALIGVQDALSNVGRPEEFSAILSDYKKKNPESTEVEKLAYDNAKNLYFSNKYPQAIDAFVEFMNDYNTSLLAYDAAFYVAESYFKLNQLGDALGFYYEVIERMKSSFVPRAALRAAEIEYQQKNYARAVQNFYTLYTISDSKQDQATAGVRLMETYYVMNKLDSSLYFAGEVLKLGDVLPGSTKKAQLYVGKVSLGKGDFAKATSEFKAVLSTSKDELGAEAKYWLSDVLYRQKKYKEAQASILELNKQFQDYEFWRVRGFILLSDVYVGLNDVDQARATLNSIIENSEDKEVVELAKAKVAKL